MKKILLFASVFCVGSIFAQGTFTQANEPALGTYSYFLCDSNAVNYSEVTGTGVTWDYSALEKYDGETRTIVYGDGSTNPDATNFPDANKYMQVEDLVSDFWISEANQRGRIGLTMTTGVAGNAVVVFDDTSKVIDYPFNMNDESHSTFTAQVSTDLGAMSASGTHTEIYDGFGTIKIGTNTISNVSRLHSIDTVHAVNVPLIGGDLDIVMNAYEYYDLANGNEPIFYHSNVVITQSGSSTPLMNNSVVVSKYEPSATVATKELAATNMTVAPNPTVDHITFRGDFNNAEVQIVNSLGQVVYSGNVSNGSSISTTNWTAGIYFAKALVNNKAITTKIVKL